MQFFCKDSDDFGLSDMKRLTKIFLLVILCFTAGVRTAYSGPVRNMDATYRQPDGTSFSVKVRGDEWTKIRTTADGCAIVMNEDGWWCYGIYDSNGRLGCTEHKVGKDTPSDIIASSRLIPYQTLKAEAARHRGMVSKADRSALQSVKAMNDPATKASSTIQKRGIAILAQFQDTKFKYTKEDFEKLLNEKGYKGTGSAKDYYEAQFGDGWEFTFDVSEIVTLPKNVKYYGENDSNGYDLRPATMAWEACKAADTSVDFSLYDQDGDGYVENVYVFYAGRDESEYTDQPNLIWAHQYYIISGTERISGVKQLDGVWIDRYACSSELSNSKITGIGTFCHEYGHTFGLPDFYDTDYDEDGSWAAGLWFRTSLMDGGNYNNNSATPPNLNCIERELLGLSSPIELEAGKSYTLEPIYKSGQYYKVSTETEGEYFLFECRSKEGWDEYIEGEGLLAYHIDKTKTEFEYGEEISWWDMNIVNTDASHQCADLIEADGRTDKIRSQTSFRNLSGIFYPQRNITSITPEETPSYKLWNGNDPEIALTGITYSGGVIKFNTGGSAAIPVAPDVTDLTYQSYPDAIFISFASTDPSSEAMAVLEWKKSSDEEYNSIELPKPENGVCSYLIKGLESGNVLYDFQARFEISGVFGKSQKAQAMTKRSPSVQWPYLYMADGGQIDSSKGMIAHVVNSADAAETTWFLDGEELEIKSGCLIFLQKSGQLNCVITWEDGSTDRITKKITLSEQE